MRQVGKTWILKEFGRRYYENIAYFNFDENEEYKEFFETIKDVERILQNLMMASGQKIKPEKTLIIFDEVQDCPKGINSMKYFCENASQYHIACAGSLMGIALSKPSSFPVGKVAEFKGALSENYVLEAFKNQFEVIPRYWSQVNPPREVDFIIQRENDIIPVEVKAEHNTEAKSLKNYKEKFNDKVKLRVRCSLDNLRLDGDLLNIPLFMADYADTLIGMALSRLQQAK